MPFEIEELFARIRTLLRRKGVESAAGYAGLHYRLRVVTFAGEVLDLTAREYAILEILVRNAGRFVSRPRLEEQLKEVNPTVEFTSHARRLRQFRVETMRGVGSHSTMRASLQRRLTWILLALTCSHG
ncbi:MAG: response regulator transcription factor [Pseudohongiellaceae bacterium]